MRRLIARSLEMLVLPLFALLSVGGSIAEAVDLNAHLLMGDYHFSRTRTCIRASDFGTGNAVVSNGSTATDAAQGTVHYNGDGTGTLTAQLLSINLNAIGNGATPVNQFDVTCELTYTVHADDTFTELLTTCTGSVIAGLGPAGGPFTTTGTKHEGLFANGRESFVFGTVSPNIEETKNADGEIVSKAICNRSGTAFKSN